MARTRQSARQAGPKFERLTADYLALHVDDRVDRRVKNGNKDRGDIGGVRSPHGHRVVIECKEHGGRINIGAWLNDAERERGNDDAQVGLVIAKRRATARPGDQIVLMTVRDLVALLTGMRPDDD